MHLITIGTCACGKRGTLVDALCGFCEPEASPTVPLPMPVARAIDLLLAELVAEEIPAPLAQRMTLGHVWIDLARLAGEPIPAHVAAMLDEPTHAAPIRTGRETHREPVYLPAD